ncbi:MAG: hypothetical protein WC080_01580 [Patescibacteria group bacterium]
MVITTPIILNMINIFTIRSVHEGAETAEKSNGYVKYNAYIGIIEITAKNISMIFLKIIRS